MEALVVSSVALYGITAFLNCTVKAVQAVRHEGELFEELGNLLEHLERVAAAINEQKDQHVTVRDWNKALGKQLEKAKAAVLEYHRVKSDSSISVVFKNKKKSVQGEIVKVTAGLKDLASQAGTVSLVLGTRCGNSGNSCGSRSSVPPPITYLCVSRMQCQMICDGCETVLNYPQGSRQVRCMVCGRSKYVPPGGMAVECIQCSHCREMLMYPGEAKAVRCTQCKKITCITKYVPPGGTAMKRVQCSHCLKMLMHLGEAKAVRCTQ